nr:hypothetical protein [Tanacetum cinerariifolium]
MHVVELGEGPPVLFLISSKGYRAIAPDLRGYGDTEAPNSPTSYTAFHIVGDLVSLLDSLGLDKDYLVSHDWGAIISWDPLVKPMEIWRNTCGDDFHVCRFQVIISLCFSKF